MVLRRNARERAIAADCEFRKFFADGARDLPAADPGIQWMHIRSEIHKPTGARRSANGTVLNEHKGGVSFPAASLQTLRCKMKEVPVSISGTSRLFQSGTIAHSSGFVKFFLLFLSQKGNR